MSTKLDDVLEDLHLENVARGMVAAQEGKGNRELTSALNAANRYTKETALSDEQLSRENLMKYMDMRNHELLMGKPYVHDASLQLAAHMGGFPVGIKSDDGSAESMIAYLFSEDWGNPEGEFPELCTLEQRDIAILVASARIVQEREAHYAEHGNYAFHGETEPNDAHVEEVA